MSVLTLEEKVNILWERSLVPNKEPNEPKSYFDRDEYDAAIKAFAFGDRGAALNAYLKKGGRIPTDD